MASVDRNPRAAAFQQLTVLAGLDVDIGARAPSVRPAPGQRPARSARLTLLAPGPATSRRQAHVSLRARDIGNAALADGPLKQIQDRRD
jgi:hypothetical protein